MRYRVLGPVAAFAGDRTVLPLGGPRQRLVLALLVKEVGRAVPDDAFVDALWPDGPPAGARHTIQTYVSELRRTLDDTIRRVAGGYVLEASRDDVDVWRFEALLAEGRQRLGEVPGEASALLREALALWHGEPYADLQDALALQAEVHRLRQERLEAVEDRIQADLDVGRHAQLATELEALARDHPYRERLHALLMLALYRSSRQAEALRAYERARRVLGEELGLDPSPELQRLQQQILNQDPALLPEVTAPADAPAVVRGFELRTRIARRGPATVWRAYQPSASREVTVTVIAAHEANTSAFVRSFEPCAQRLATLRHPHLLRLLDHWRDPRGAYLVTPSVGGASVRATLVDGPWSLSAMMRLVEQVGAALTVLHDADLVHGDVDADTVLLDEHGSAHLTTTGVILGATPRPQALAPEVRQDRPASAATDVHGLAVLALEVLTGRPAPQADAPLTALEDAGVVAPPGVERVLAHALAPEPASRHVRAEDLVADLRRAMGTAVTDAGDTDAAASGMRNPYKGLRAFEESDGPDFHGREVLVAQLVQAVGDRRLVAVVGPSGSGKSSVVRAGLVPALRMAEPERWLFTDMLPGAYPFEELEAALLRVAVDRPEGLLGDLLSDAHGMVRAAKAVLPPDGELVLVIDQFEELFSLTTDPHLRRLFLDGLVALADDELARVRTVVTLRADFFDRPLQHHAFARLLRDGLVAVGMPSPQELAAAVARPAHDAGVTYEPGLVETIVAHVADQPGSLPLLQHSLTELFDRREGRLLTADAYRATGGVPGALGRRAEGLFGSLPAPAQAAAEQVFLRLVTVNERGEDTRRRARRAELGALEVDPAAVETVIRVFGGSRLLSFDHDPVTRSPTVEVAHEALFLAWTRLRGWIETRREDLALRRRLATAVDEWEQAGEGSDYLLAGGRLEQFERWARATQLALTAPERGMLEASRRHEDERAARRQRRRRAFVGGLAVAALLASVLAGFALVQRDRARTGERVALSRELSASSRLQQAIDHDLSVLLALEAVDAARDVGARPLRDALAALHEAVLAHRLLATVDAGGTLVATAGTDERVFISGPPSHRATVWDLVTGETLAVLRDDGREPFQAAASADGRRAVETFVGAPTLVWDLEAGELLREIPATSARQLWPALSPDGRTLALANLPRFGLGAGQTISLWDLDTGDERLRFPHDGNARHLAFAPDGQQLAVADMQNAIVRLYDTATGEVIRVIGDPTDARGVNSVAFHPSGEQLAMFLFTPRELRIVALATDEVVASVPLGTASIGARLCYSGDGDALAVATGDDILNVYDASGQERIALPGSRSIESLVCTSSGDRVILATDDGVARLWGLGADHAGEVRSIAAPAPFFGVWAPAGDALLTTHFGGALMLRGDGPPTGSLHRYDPASGALVAHVGDLHPFPPWWLAVSPDGHHVATNANPFGDIDPAEAGVDVPRSARLRVHNAVTLEPILEVEGGGWPLAFSEDSALLLAGGSGIARVVEMETGRVRLEVVVASGEDPPEIGAGAFVPGGRHAALVGHLTRLGWIVDVHAGEVTATFCRAGGTAKAALSPDGRRLAVAAGPGTTEVWDVATLLRTGGAGCDEDDGAGLVRTLEGDAAMGITFDPGGRLLAAAGFDGVVTVWDADSGEQELRIVHDGQVGGASFSPDGRHLLVTVNDAGGTLHAVRIYTLDADELVAIARRRVTRDLHPRECETFLSGQCPAR